jgi:hypothetical protein
MSTFALQPNGAHSRFSRRLATALLLYLLFLAPFHLSSLRRRISKVTVLVAS